MKRKAQMRMIELREPVMAQLIRIVNDKKVSDADKIKAAKLVLDRTDPVNVKVDASIEVKPWQRMLDRLQGGAGREELPEGIQDRLEELDLEDLKRELRATQARLAEYESGRLIEGQVVEPRPIERPIREPEPVKSRTSLRAELPPAPPKGQETVAASEDHTHVTQAPTREPEGDHTTRLGRIPPSPVARLADGTRLPYSADPRFSKRRRPRQCSCGELSGDSSCPVHKR